jgi:eukaryotic-like serine/threonine-protein kinase
MQIGTTIGAYQVIAKLGEGGMGEVYRARDAKLNREVALKVLPEAFRLEPDRLARFKREAQVLASLNHSHIAAIYGFEDSNPSTDGQTAVHALVLELVEGPTLADRIARGPIPLDEAVPIARQVAEALEAAHEQGIVHRDLKPANVKVRPDGTVKVLDFGLAKALEPAAAIGGDATASPTITSPAMTQMGIILGTAAYMSPEQAKGRHADKRSDVWAFGALLYEMLSGRRAFAGDDISDTIAAVLRQDVDWTALPASTPADVRRLIGRCLERDARRRLRDIGEARIVLEDPDVRRRDAGDAAARAPSRPLWRRAIPIAAAALGGALLAAGTVWLLTRPAPPSVVRTIVTTSGSTALALSGTDRDVAITPDGSRIVYRGTNQLLVRAINQLEPTVLGGLGAPRSVFVSPDGQWIGFFDGTTIKKVAITGGPPVTIARIESAGFGGATWGPDGTIIFATGAPATGLRRVSAAGGEPTVLTKPDRERGERDHRRPEFLPGGGAVLFTIQPFEGDTDRIAVLDLRSGTSKVLIDGGSDAHYVPTGHLVFGVEGTLRAVAFDLGRLAVVGTPAPVLDAVMATGTGAFQVALAANGSLVYVPGTDGGRRQSVVSVDRQGRVSPLPGLPPDAYRDVRVSPDGARLALATEADVWTYDVVRATRSRLTTDPASDRSPLWTPDGKRIIFRSTRARYPELFWRLADGTGRDEHLLARAKDLLDLYPSGWSADGRRLLFTEVPLQGRCAIGQMVIERPSDANVLGESCTSHPAVSPNGGWMAYRSNVSGQNEVYVERYPQLGNRQQISTGGGHVPIWSRDGSELFFTSLDGRQMLAVTVQPGSTLVAGRPQVLFETAIAVSISGRSYDVTPEGRFLIIGSGRADSRGGTSSNMILVQNWFDELERLVPVN